MALRPADPRERSPVPAPPPADAVTPGSPAQLKGKTFGAQHGESEAAEVLALLAGDTPGSSSGGPAAVAPATVGPAPPGGAPQTGERCLALLADACRRCGVLAVHGRAARLRCRTSQLSLPLPLTCPPVPRRCPMQYGPAGGSPVLRSCRRREQRPRQQRSRWLRHTAW